MKSYSSREIIKMLNENGWYEVACVGDHHQFKHPNRDDKITIPHPVKDVPINIARSILKQAGLL